MDSAQGGTRHPNRLDHLAGGSSTGSGVAVATGAGEKIRDGDVLGRKVKLARERVRARGVGQLHGDYLSVVRIGGRLG